MLFEAGRSPILAERRVLMPLAVFGLVHGSHEWVEMFLIKSSWFVVRNPPFWGWFRVSVLVFSFVALIIFGLQMLNPQGAFIGPYRVFWIFGLAGYVCLVLLAGLACWKSQTNIAGCFDVLARYLLAFPGAAIAGFALYREARRSVHEGISPLAPPLFAASLGFFVYAASQLVVSPLIFFPANFLNIENFQAWTGIPIQLVRAAMAVLITLSLIRATQVTEEVRKRQLIAEQHARIDALDRLDEELRKKEAMRKELLGHVVQAQEDERSRIARELHDETSQALTAFTFHLAALQKMLGHDLRFEEPLGHLRSLSRRMSLGIHRLMHDLRPALLDDLGLTAALQNLSDGAEMQMGINVEFKVSGNQRRLNPTIETALYRIAQEGLTNTARHASVQAASVRIEFNENTVMLLVSDEGIGFQVDDSTDQGWGLKGIRERADSIGARLTINSSPGKGTSIEVVVQQEADIP